MSFVHEDPNFVNLLGIVAEDRNIAPALVEKDYWVTHSLWALQTQGWDLWFKGGTSLSKGFSLLERFSEDLDLKLLPGAVPGPPMVSSWKSEGVQATKERRLYFEAMAQAMHVPGALVALADKQDRSWRGANLEVRYPGHYLDGMAALGGRDHVLLEIGEARVTPHVLQDLDSFVHAQLRATGQAQDFLDNRPKGLRCVHPLVTLLEKLDAISRRFPLLVAAAAFVRHYDDAMRIIQAKELPRLSDFASPKALVRDLLDHKQIKAFPNEHDPAFTITEAPRWRELQAAWNAIAPIYWGPRNTTLEKDCETIRTWIRSLA